MEPPYKPQVKSKKDMRTTYSPTSKLQYLKGMFNHHCPVLVAPYVSKLFSNMFPQAASASKGLDFTRIWPTSQQEKKICLHKFHTKNPGAMSKVFFCVFFSDVPLRVYVKPKPVLKVPCCLSMCFGIGMMMKDENPTNGCMTGSNLVPLGSAHIFGPYQGRWKWLGQGLCHVQLIGSETRHFDPFCTIPSRHVVWCDARFLPLRCEFTSIISIFSYT